MEEEKKIYSGEPEERKDNQQKETPVISTPDESGVRTYQLQKKEKKKAAPYKGVIIFAIIVLAILVLAVSCNNTVGKIFTSGTGAGMGSGDLPQEPYIATLYVEGSIASGNVDYFGAALGYQHQWTLDQIDEMIADQNNKALILFVDSPGGGVYESDELYLKIKGYQEETGRPVYAYFGSMAASGGYYISAPADKIIANRNCWTGSIGVTIGTLFDFSQLLEEYGIRTETITSGANKAMGSSFDQLTEEQRQIFQGLVDEAYYQFAGIVSEEREIPMEELLKIADGRIYTASQALELGLVDEIAGFDEAVLMLQQDYDLEDVQVVDVEYLQNTLFGSLLGSFYQGSRSELGQLSLFLELTEKGRELPISYTSPYLKEK